MKLIFFKVMQSLALLVVWPVALVAMCLGALWFSAVGIAGGLAHVWTFSPKDHHV